MSREAVLGKVTPAMDVYAFGITILETVTGRPAEGRPSARVSSTPLARSGGNSGSSSADHAVSDDDHLVTVLEDALEEFDGDGDGSGLCEFVDPLLRLVSPTDGLPLFAIAVECKEEKHKRRPSSSEVLKKLEDVLAGAGDVRSRRPLASFDVGSTATTATSVEQPPTSAAPSPSAPIPPHNNDLRRAIFVSHSRRDPAALNAVYALLEALRSEKGPNGTPISRAVSSNSVFLWVDKDQMSMYPGASWATMITKAQHDALSNFFFLSNAFCGSEECMQELEYVITSFSLLLFMSWVHVFVSMRHDLCCVVLVTCQQPFVVIYFMTAKIVSGFIRTFHCIVSKYECTLLSILPSSLPWSSRNAHGPSLS